MVRRSFRRIEFKAVRRYGNWVAYHLARNARFILHSDIWLEEAPQPFSLQIFQLLNKNTLIIKKEQTNKNEIRERRTQIDKSHYSPLR